MKKNSIPLFSPKISNSDLIAIKKAFKNQILTAGPILEQFEKKFAKFVGSKYAIGVSNATSGLFLSLKTANLQKGDEVIVPNMTFVATSNAVLHAGGKPVIVDVNYDDMNIALESINSAINRKTKFIIPVHFAGKPCQMREINKIATERKIIVIEDCAHAIGSKIRNKHVGNFGLAGCFSFYPTKNITTIEGGMVITNSKEFAKKIFSMRNHGMTKTLSQRYNYGKPWDYDVIDFGYNFRMDEIRSALGISQLKRINQMNKERKYIAKYYDKNLKKIRGIDIPKNISDNDAHHLYIIKVLDDYPISRNELFSKLLRNKISTTVHYKPLHLFSAYDKFHKNNFKISTKLYEEILSLPFFPGIKKAQLDRVINIIKNTK